MNRKQEIDKMLREEYEDQCDHPRVVMVLPYNPLDIEGGGIKLVCEQCRETVGEAVMYE